MTIEEARAALDVATRALSEAKSARACAMLAVDVAHRVPIADAERAQYKADAALRKAQSEAAPDHPLEGKTVYRIEREYRRWGTGYTERKVAGVVFTYRPGMSLGRSRIYGAKIGDPMVRLLKKDGKQGATCESFMSSYLSGEPPKPKWFESPEDAVFVG